jgi:hypothetical protein
MSITSVTSRNDLDAKVRAYLGNLKRTSSLTSKTDKARSMVTDITKPQPQLAPPSEYQTNEEKLSDEILQFKKLEKEVVNTVFSTDKDRLKFKLLIRENNMAPVNILRIWNNFSKDLYNDKIPVLTPEELVNLLRRYILSAYADPKSKEVQEEAENLKTGILTQLKSVPELSPTDFKRVVKVLESQASQGDVAYLQKESDALSVGDQELFSRMVTRGGRRRASVKMEEEDPLFDVKEYEPEERPVRRVVLKDDTVYDFEQLWEEYKGKPSEQAKKDLTTSVLDNKKAWAQALSDGMISNMFGLKDEVKDILRETTKPIPSRKGPTAGGRLRKVIMGCGIDLASVEEDELVKLGKIFINRTLLEKDRLEVLNSKMNKLGRLSSGEVSDTFRRMVEKLLVSRPFVDEPTFKKLSTSEKEFFTRLVAASGCSKLLGFKYEPEEVSKDAQRFAIVSGEILAGNDNPELVKELKLLTLRLRAAGKISVKKFNLITEQLMLLNI